MGQKVQGSSFSSAARDAPELTVLQGLVVAKKRATKQRAAKLRSRSKATRNKVTQRKLRSLAPELAALQQASKQENEEDFLPFRVRSSRSSSTATALAPAPAAPAPQPPEVSGALAME
jgi:hypothetical protein